MSDQTIAEILKSLGKYHHVRAEHHRLDGKTITFKDWAAAELTPMQVLHIINTIVETTATLQFTPGEIDQILFPILHKYPHEVNHLKMMLTDSVKNGTLRTWVENTLISAVRNKRPINSCGVRGVEVMFTFFHEELPYPSSTNFSADGALHIGYGSCTGKHNDGMRCTHRLSLIDVDNNKCPECGSPTINQFMKDWIEEDELKELVRQTLNLERHKEKLTKKIHARLKNLDVDKLYLMVRNNTKFDSFEEEIHEILNHSNIKHLYASLKKKENE